MPLIARFGLSIGLAALVVCTPLLPPEHIHLAGIEGRTQALVHSHEDDGDAIPGSRTSVTGSHGDHARAVYLTSVYERTAGANTPATLAVTAVVVLPVALPGGAVHADHGHPIHGPPGPVWLTRGPPVRS